MEIQQNISLKPFTTFKVGGKADYFCKVTSLDELKQAIEFGRRNNLEIFVLGHGSNILISDEGFRGLVIKIELFGIEFTDNKIIAGAGESWDKIVELSVERELYGIENMSFIPGTVGGAVIGNIGAYGNEIKDVVESVEVLNVENLETISLNKNECRFDYRNSIFKTEKKDYIITKIFIKLSKNDKLNLSYKDLKEFFKDKNPTLKDVRNAVKKIREKKLPSLSKYGTAGSFFKNPIIKGNKVYLAKTLDNLGLKGLRVGNVALYKNQSLVVVNLGGASAYEIKNFTDNIAQKVFDKFKIKIKEEIIFVGEFETLKH